jgi:hypothetical protein
MLVGLVRTLGGDEGRVSIIVACFGAIPCDLHIVLSGLGGGNTEEGYKDGLHCGEQCGTAGSERGMNETQSEMLYTARTAAIAYLGTVVHRTMQQ